MAETETIGEFREGTIVVPLPPEVRELIQADDEAHRRWEEAKEAKLAALVALAPFPRGTVVEFLAECPEPRRCPEPCESCVEQVTESLTAYGVPALHGRIKELEAELALTSEAAQAHYEAATAAEARLEAAEADRDKLLAALDQVMDDGWVNEYEYGPKNGLYYCRWCDAENPTYRDGFPHKESCPWAAWREVSLSARCPGT